jgi:hypothetical protein
MLAPYRASDGRARTCAHEAGARKHILKIRGFVQERAARHESGRFRPQDAAAEREEMSAGRAQRLSFGVGESSFGSDHQQNVASAGKQRR